MLRSTGITGIALTAALLPAFAQSTMETLRIQIGKDKAVLDTVMIEFDFGKVPEIDHPNGVEWADLEKDSAWEDADGKHVRSNHSFRASMGSRKGYGNEYIHYTTRGNQLPEYSANVSFVFPGDTLVQMSWEPVHMYEDYRLYPYGRTGFVSGCPIYGQVSTFADKQAENLTQGQWVLLQTRKRIRPEGETKPVVSRKETLRIQMYKGEAIMDTIVVSMDYGKPPEVDPASGGTWAEWEKDSAWSDDLGWYVRYSHSFMVSMGTRKGSGGDYLWASANPEDFVDFARRTASVGIHIPGDTSLSIHWEGDYIVEKAEAYPYHKSSFKTGGQNGGKVYKATGTNVENMAEDEWALLLAREEGWVEEPVALHPVKPAGRTGDWIINLGPGTVLRAPPGATGLKVFDVHGRIHWESRNLREGAQVTLPGDLPKGALRYYWQSRHSPGA